MQMKWILALALGLIMTTDAAFAGGGKKKEKGGGGKNKGWEKKFDKIDTNADGLISKDEFQTFKAQHHKHGKKDKKANAE